ncbi:MAG: hypothetical protein EZS28_042546, partial [Streblomastix strix]
MDNINSEGGNRTKIYNIILMFDLDTEENEYKSVGRVETENATIIEGLVQHEILKQTYDYGIISSADRQIELPKTPDKRSISISNGIRQSEDANV